MSYLDALTVGPSPRKILKSVAIGTIALTGGVAMLAGLLELLAAAGLLGLVGVPAWLWSARWSIVAWTAAVAAGYRTVALAGAVLLARPRLEIGPDGFIEYGVVGRRARRWTDINGPFNLVRVGWPVGIFPQPAVAYRLTGACKASTRITPIAALGENDEGILTCGELEIGAEELADLLNRWKKGDAFDFRM